MLKPVNQRIARLFLPALVILMLWGTPAVNPAFADCATATSSCTVPI